MANSFCHSTSTAGSPFHVGLLARGSMSVSWWLHAGPAIPLSHEKTKKRANGAISRVLFYPFEFASQ
jgi:hypothetical protein